MGWPGQRLAIRLFHLQEIIVSSLMTQGRRRSGKTPTLVLAALLVGPAAALAASEKMPEASAGDPAGAVRVGEPAPDFTLQSSGGDTYTLADRQGDRNVVLVFFRGTW